ncbi:MAG TPA: hypothetical protein VMY35_06480, partial [Phycisphaerae bacterium]|nr:hypothetical protein [Phycisphaerae bacterium]
DDSLKAAGFNVAIPRLGWEYVGWRYLPAVAAGNLEYHVSGVYIERLHRAGDWTALGIGS